MGLFSWIRRKQRNLDVAALEVSPSPETAPENAPSEPVTDASIESIDRTTESGATAILALPAEQIESGAASTKTATITGDSDEAAFAAFLETSNLDTPEAPAIVEGALEAPASTVDLAAEATLELQPISLHDTINPDVEWAMRSTYEPVTTTTLATADVRTSGLDNPIIDAVLNESAAPITTSVESPVASEAAVAFPAFSEATLAAIDESPIPVIESPVIASLPVAATVDEIPAPAATVSLKETARSFEPAVLDEATAPAAEIRRLRDPIVDELIMKLMDEARNRADSAVSAYETLADKVGDYATRSNRTARTAWSLVGTLAVGIFVGGIWGSYRLARETSIAESLQEKVVASAGAITERDELRTQLSMSHAAEFQAQLESKAAQQAAARAEVELQSYQRRTEAELESRARQTGYAPATQPSGPQAAVTPATQPAASTASPVSQAMPAPAARPSDSWATLLSQ